MDMCMCMDLYMALGRLVATAALFVVAGVSAELCMCVCVSMSVCVFIYEFGTTSGGIHTCMYAEPHLRRNNIGMRMCI
jgi:hypothetical protein